MIVAEILHMGRKLNQYQLDATSGGLWTDTTHFKTTAVAAHRRQLVLGGVTNRSVSGTVVIYAYDVSGNIIACLANEGAATGITGYPESTTFMINAPMILDEGEYIQMTFGAAQGATAYASCVVIEVEL